MNVVQRTSGFVAVVAVLSYATAAHAGAFRTYLSVKGDDANSCSVVTPCRLLPAALAAVNNGGEVWILDSANYNIGTVVIDKSVTILAVHDALGSVVANGSAISGHAAVERPSRDTDPADGSGFPHRRGSKWIDILQPRGNTIALPGARQAGPSNKEPPR